VVEHTQMRVSDSERQAAVDRLRPAHDEGRLDLDEYDRRLGAAYASLVPAPRNAAGIARRADGRSARMPSAPRIVWIGYAAVGAHRRGR
jgi:hypothetical protein